MNFNQLYTTIQILLDQYDNNNDKKDDSIIDNVEKMFEEFLSANPYHVEATLRFAVFVFNYFDDFYKPLEILKPFIEFESNNHQAILIMAFIATPGAILMKILFLKSSMHYLPIIEKYNPW